jgi:drug/metabolite transporter (DMT)-like permease
MITGRIYLATSFALLMFAANSILCRLALGSGSIDAASFSSIRLISGAAVLLLVVLFTGRSGIKGAGDWWSAFFLFLYAVPFSFAYNDLTTGTGALILFGAVQITMFYLAWSAGERMRVLQWIGSFMAAAGLVYLVLPGLESPSIFPAFLMGIAGMSWGIYSIRGRRNGDATVRTYGNFVRAVPMVLLVSVFMSAEQHITTEGATLAIFSGAGASAFGYVVWYFAVKQLKGVQASVLQLLVPVLAAIGGILLLQEQLTFRLAMASAIVIGGVALATAIKKSEITPPSISRPTASRRILR